MKSLFHRACVFTAIATLYASPLSAATVSAQDAAFATKAAQAGVTEVKLASTALQKSKSAAVVSFAEQMKTDHTKANVQLTAIAKAKGLTIPSDVGPKNEAVIAKLEAASGSAFDTAYLKSQLPAHRQVLALFKKEAAMGTDTDLVAFAKQTIPVIMSHIAMDKRDIRKAMTVGMR